VQVALAPSPVGPDGTWLKAALARIAEEDSQAAGEAIVSLLPAQHLVWDAPLVYDLLLEREGVIEVTVKGGRTGVERRAPGQAETGGAREPRVVDFLVQGDLAGLAQLLLGSEGGERGEPGFAPAKVRGSTAALGALRQLVSSKLSLPELLAAGVRLRPGLALRLVAGMVEPRWAAERELTLGFRSPDGEDHAHVRLDGRDRPVVRAGAAEGERGTVVICAEDAFLEVLLGRARVPFELLGSWADLAAVRRWVARAQGLGTDFPI
jgi:hypothetical protein